MTDETNGAKRERRRLTVKDQLEEMDRKIENAEDRLRSLRAQRDKIVNEARAKANAIMAEVGPA